eukprot:1153051-Pelagomonas_calceolata.AAC.5
MTCWAAQHGSNRIAASRACMDSIKLLAQTTHLGVVSLHLELLPIIRLHPSTGLAVSFSRNCFKKA